jgi:hypothetical protein
MELIDVMVSTRLLNGLAGTFTLAHASTDLTRGLNPLEEVVIRDLDGELHAATVEDIDYTLDDTVYLLQVGVRLPPEIAEERLRQDGPGATSENPEDGVEDVQSIVDLLGRLRRRPRGEA